MNNVKKVENRVELNKGEIIDQMIKSINKRKITDNANYLVQPYNVTVTS